MKELKNLQNDLLSRDDEGTQERVWRKTWKEPELFRAASVFDRLESHLLEIGGREGLSPRLARRRTSHPYIRTINQLMRLCLNRYNFLIKPSQYLFSNKRSRHNPSQ
ncbi:hypothetical protein Fot_42702 [Forsythia ovata]|uniref:Uncharacterized protein n=1 Tax=Forsythia ovata TaxID=205694 RepID=A0ABD1RLY3_9LAMI